MRRLAINAMESGGGVVMAILYVTRFHIATFMDFFCTRYIHTRDI